MLAAWDAFLACAAEADLAQPSRLPRWSGRDVCVHLGVWEGEDPVEEMVAAARGGGNGAGEVPSADEMNERKIARHRDDPVEEVLDALARAREQVAAAFALPDLPTLAGRTTMSSVGPLPLLTHLNAAAYELAVHALDLHPCGAPEPSPELLSAGLSALLDVTGGLAARHRVHATVTALSPQGGWAFAAADGGWHTAEIPVGPVGTAAGTAGSAAPGGRKGAVIRGEARVLLDASAGRVSVPPLLIDGRIRVHDMGELLRLTPLLDEVPGLPGGGPLKVAARVVGGVRGGASMLLGRLRGR